MLFSSPNFCLISWISTRTWLFHFPFKLFFFIQGLSVGLSFSIFFLWPKQIHLKRERGRENGAPSLNPSNLKADVIWFPTSKGPVKCREGEIIYFWLVFLLVNVNKPSTWLLSEPWPWPHGNYIIRLRRKKHSLLFQPCLVGLISDLQVVKLILEEARELDQISARPPALG